VQRKDLRAGCWGGYACRSAGTAGLRLLELGFELLDLLKQKVGVIRLVVLLLQRIAAGFAQAEALSGRMLVSLPNTTSPGNQMGLPGRRKAAPDCISASVS
jgi:hypothetical protein